MILIALAAAAAAPTAEEARFASCVELSASDPKAALDEAGRWQLAGGGVLAKQCAGLAYASDKRWLPAATAFEQAATQAERAKDGRAARLWVQAGNAALAGNDLPKARQYLDSAIVSGQLHGAEAGEAFLDRARVSVALNDPKTARPYIDAALKAVPADPLAWLLSATLARRTGDLNRAQKDIAEAARLSPDDASVALEAGNIAIRAGSEPAARAAWEAAVKNAPQSPAGRTAAEQLARLGGK